MRKWTPYIKLMPVLLVQALSSCSLIDEPEYEGDVSVEASLAFTVSSAERNITRMADNVVQEQPANGQSYRGLGDVYMIPFIISGDEVTVTDEPTKLFDDASRVEGTTGTFYLYRSYKMNRGVNAFLVYGRAGNDGIAVPSGVENKAYLGSLQPSSDLTMPNLQELRFALDPIYSNDGAPAEAGFLAAYLTYIAQTPGWSDTTDPTLLGYYLSFTGLKNEGNMVLAGSSANVIAHVNALYSDIKTLNDELSNNIRSRIQNPQVSDLTLTSTGTGENWKLTGINKTVNAESVNIEYPTSAGLPDGAAALRWVKEPDPSTQYAFAPRVETTTLDNINNIKRFSYPAELFYHANSRINTSNWMMEENVYKSSDWNDVCDQYQYKPGVVTNSTKSVAICDPLQYAVGRLKINLKAETTTGTLKDSKGDDVPLSYGENQYSFPLTGIIVCNQHPVDFNFKPVLDNGAASHVFDRFIYDSQVKSDNTYHYLKTSEQSIPSTLVLQTYDTGEGSDKKGSEDVNIVMEFQNNSGQTFYGKNCVIYNGTKFYLIGQIKPSEATSSNEPSEAKGRVFTQDYVTTINTKVQSLANAYNVLPDLIGGRLELGIELVSTWVQAETTNVILK